MPKQRKMQLPSIDKINIISIIKIFLSVKNFHLLLADFLGILNKEYKLKLRTGIEIYIRPGTFDKNVVYEIFLRNDYLINGIQVRDSDTILDVGANIGIFSILVAGMCPNGRIYAIEPIPDNCEILRRNIKLNKISNIEILELALSDHDGHDEIYIDDRNLGGNSFFIDGVPLKVKVITLESLIRTLNLERINLIKMDCEGSEFDIIMSSSDEILCKIEYISLEYHEISGRPSPSDLVEFLRNHHFQVNINSNKSHLDSRIGMIYAMK